MGNQVDSAGMVACMLTTRKIMQAGMHCKFGSMRCSVEDHHASMLILKASWRVDMHVDKHVVKVA